MMMTEESKEKYIGIKMTDMEWQTIGRNVRPQTKLLSLWWLIYPIKLAEKTK